METRVQRVLDFGEGSNKYSVVRTSIIYTYDGVGRLGIAWSNCPTRKLFDSVTVTMARRPLAGFFSVSSYSHDKHIFRVVTIVGHARAMMLQHRGARSNSVGIVYL